MQSRNGRAAPRVHFVASAALAAAMSAALAAPALAAGFYVREASTSAMLTGFAGAASRGDDATHLFYNPATIILNAPKTVTLDVRGFFPDIRIDATSAIGPFGPVAGVPGTGGMADAAAAPGIFASYALSETFSIGIGGSAPFAVVIDTDPAWIGRFHVLKTDMRAYNLNPVFAWRISDMVTVGAGLAVQYFDADLQNAQPFAIPPGAPFETVGFLRGDDVGVGVTAGILIEPGPATKIGLGYRSRVTHDLAGTAGVTATPLATQAVHFEITTPDIVTASVSHRVNDALTLHGTAEWANWSLFDAIVVRFDSGLLPDEVRPQNWSDTWSAFFGGSYRLSDTTTLHAGGGFTQAVSGGAGSAITPDGDRITLALGVICAASEGLVVKAGYAHTFFRDTNMNILSPTAGTLTAVSRMDVDIVGVSATLNW